MIALALLALFGPDDGAVLPPEHRPRKMLYAYLEAECAKEFEARRQAVALLKTPEDLRERQEDLRAKFVRALGGFPEKTPLEGRVLGTLEKDGYRIEKVVYFSRPEHPVTANFYRPEGPGPFPGVLLPCGHSDKGKAEDAYQLAARLMAKNGLAVLCYDPIGQGERMQILDPSGKPIVKGTTEHTMVEVSSLLVGWSTASFRIWDGIRSLDYLASRPEVDPRRLGCTGNSGGGTMTAYLMALDDRIACAAPSCYITTLERLFATIGPQDGEQNITGQVAFGMEQTDYVTMRAPKPTLICTATQDFFDIQGAWTTFREAKRLYGMIGHPERVDLVEINDKHGFSRPRREAATRWMRRWLLGVDDAPVETPAVALPEADLRCTKSGQVLTEWGGKSVLDLVSAREHELAPARTRDARRVIKSVEASLGVRGAPPPAALDFVGDPVPAGKEAPRLAVYKMESGIPLPAAVWGAQESGSNVFIVHPGGHRAVGAAQVREWTKTGHPVIVPDLRGFGETTPDEKEGYFGPEWKEAFLGLHLGRPLLGQRVWDLLSLMNRPDPTRGISFIGVGTAAPVVLHAAALDSRVTEVTLEGMLLSWSALAQAPVSKGQWSSVAPGVLKSYDFPEVAAAIAPRRLTVRNPVDPAGEPVTQAVLEATYQKAREIYASMGASDHLVLEGKK
jgi:dienelactone hydrolase